MSARDAINVLAIAALGGFIAYRAMTVPHAQTATLSGPALVIDGDTIRIGEVHVRLAGIDAPESDQFCGDDKGEQYRCGLLATAVLEEQIGGQIVTCLPSGTDHYGRALASCEVNHRDLGDYMVRTGWAIAYRRYSDRYEAAEDEARAAHRGIWQGGFVEPERWRHRAR
ncbi:MAG: thermonuclease family protein [Xanthobacteraceae bacterium]|jgi:endonuclease YncB( thermonuclease family)